MEKLTKTEEPIMQIIWKLQRVFINDIVDELPDPKPPYNTISSIVRILESKKILGYETFGRTHRYFPLISIKQYRKLVFHSVLNDYFENSYSSLMSHILKDEKLEPEEIEELRKIIKENNNE
jgi:BlaI family transcriptional regulator, penicillinase repressor